jgi:hypothetical protein
MELEQRVEELELEMKALKLDIQKTLIEIRDALPEKPSAPARWQKKAWVLALINMLLAVVLFTNMYLYLPGTMPFEINPTLTAWLRALWLAIAFIWLLLQMYPLALLLEQEDSQWQGVVWRNTTAFIRARPGSMVVLTLAVLVVAIINTAIPAAWLIVALTLLIAIGSIAMRSLLELFRERNGAHGRG